MTQRPSDSGSACVELAVLTPMLLFILLLGVALGRTVTASLALDHAATAATRAASLARTPSAASTAAMRTGTRVLAEQDLSCTGIEVDTDTSRFGTAGLPGAVTVILRCSVPLADLTGLPGLPASIALQAGFTSPVDAYRSRT
ncbi:pilus assembly protein TadE [Saccharopolyspora hirsuta]|uniref:Pilus assembly protein TadE n=1 Tax=Saccharopolyspora hirsuta TaxID=1837 RepID=A0A5M7B9P9_SACHI|nr:TadE/TadG family type IV pilus assembly protein [Saccharopolyspora hirsuta]KAA5825440.1 pilus assembly protein TadE [Saccharopolyspora hirsuta]